MSPPQQRSGAPETPHQVAATAKRLDDTTVPLNNEGEHVGVALRRRREAGLRLPPMACGCHDPVDCMRSPDGPSDFGLMPDDLAAEARRQYRNGWAVWELHARFDLAKAS